jgi:hypothetical protein
MRFDESKKPIKAEYLDLDTSHNSINKTFLMTLMGTTLIPSGEEKRSQRK